MRRITGYSLWLGNIGDARNLVGLLAMGIMAIVDLAMDEPPVPLTRELAYFRLPLIDGGGNPHWLLRAAIETVASLIRASVPTLVYCSAGMSRTPLIVGAAIALVRECPAAEGLAVVVETGAVDVSPVLWLEIQSAIVDL